MRIDSHRPASCAAGTAHPPQALYVPRVARAPPQWRRGRRPTPADPPTPHRLRRPRGDDRCVLAVLSDLEPQRILVHQPPSPCSLDLSSPTQPTTRGPVAFRVTEPQPAGPYRYGRFVASAIAAQATTAAYPDSRWSSRHASSAPAPTRRSPANRAAPNTPTSSNGHGTSAEAHQPNAATAPTTNGPDEPSTSSSREAFGGAAAGQRRQHHGVGQRPGMFPWSF